MIVDGAGVVQPWLVKQAVDTNIAARDLAGLGRTALLLGLALLAGYGFQVISGYGIQYLGQRLLVDLRMNLFRKVLRLSNDYFDRTPVGQTLTNLSNDLEALREFIADGIVSVAGDLLKVAFIVVAMLLINVELALVAFITIPLFVTATLLFRTGIRAGFRQVRKANGEINVALSETISGVREIHQFGYEAESRASFDRNNRSYLVAYLKVVNAYALFFPAIEIVTYTSMILTLLFAHFWLGTRVHVGEIFAFFAYITMFFMPLRQLAEKFNLLQSAVAATERIFRLMDEPVSVVSPTADLPHPIASPAELVFDEVRFHYSPESPILRGISFRVAPGEKVAIVGPTGAGKTTLISLVTRLYDVQAGTDPDRRDQREGHSAGPAAPRRGHGPAGCLPLHGDRSGEHLPVRSRRGLAHGGACGPGGASQPVRGRLPERLRRSRGGGRPPALRGAATAPGALPRVCPGPRHRDPGRGHVEHRLGDRAPDRRGDPAAPVEPHGPHHRPSSFHDPIRGPDPGACATERSSRRGRTTSFWRGTGCTASSTRCSR